MSKTATLNIKVSRVPDRVNADLMSDEELYEKIARGVDDMENGRTRLASEVFEEHRRKREKFDYTKWQRDYFDKIDDFHKEAIEYGKNHPYSGKAQVL